jgi:CRP-like cAMP-binding protein
MASPRSSIYEHPFLRAMVPEHRSILVQGAEEQAFGTGEILFREGQPANRLYLLQEGEVALETHIHGKGDVPIATIGQGQVLGWSWLVPPYVWHFQARACEPTRAIVLNGGHLLVASEQDHYLGYEMMKNISKVVLEVLLLAHQRWLSGGRYPTARTEKPTSLGSTRSSDALEDRMAEHPFFHAMPESFLRTLAEMAIAKEFKPGQSVFEAGDPADGLYALESGRLVLEARYGGTCVPVQTLQAGDAFGWSSFCEPYEWQFDARAIDVTQAMFFKASRIRERCAADYHLGYEITKRITRMMLQRLEATRNRMWEAFR